MSFEKTPKLQEGIDYTISKEDLLMFTKEYLLKRGTCCDSGCTNCPYPKSEY